MKFEIELRSTAEKSSHQIDLPATARREAGAPLEFTLDGSPAVADWAEVGSGAYSILVGGRSYRVRVAPQPKETDATVYVVSVGSTEFAVSVRDPRAWRRGGSGVHTAGPQELVAPMPGKVVRVLVAEGQEVSAGDGLLVVEAMKMQSEMRAPRFGRVIKVYVREGMGVEMGAKLVRLG